MEDIEQLGIDIASKEAEYFWERIESVSAEQQQERRDDPDLAESLPL